MNKYIFFLLIIFHFSLFTFHLASAEAQTMSNNNYVLQYGSLNPVAGSSANNSFRLESRLGGTNGPPNPAIPKASPKQEEALSFEISELFIDFGTLSATNPVIRTNNISVLSPFGSYEVLAYEDHELKSLLNNTIPNTTCDQGTCSSDFGGSWESTLAYGFGYRCDNKTEYDCDSDFKTSSFYRQFSKDKGGKSIMKGVSNFKPKESQITYKINISTSQPQEAYNTVIHYLLIPGY